VIAPTGAGQVTSALPTPGLPGGTPAQLLDALATGRIGLIGVEAEPIELPRDQARMRPPRIIPRRALVVAAFEFSGWRPLFATEGAHEAPGRVCSRTMGLLVDARSMTRRGFYFKGEAARPNMRE